MTPQFTVVITNKNDCSTLAGNYRNTNMTFSTSGNLSKDAHALAPIRFLDNDHLKHYDATTFSEPYKGCELIIRRAEAFGYILSSQERVKGEFAVDVLDKNGDILDTLEVTEKGFNYLIRELKC